MLGDNVLHILDLLAGLALGRGDGDVGDLDDVVLALGGFVFVAGPFLHVVEDELLLVVGDVAVLGGARGLVAVFVFGAVVDAGSEDVGGEEE